MDHPQNQESSEKQEKKKPYKKPTAKKYDRLYEPGLGT